MCVLCCLPSRSWQMPAPPWAWVFRLFLPFEKEFFSSQCRQVLANNNSVNTRQETTGKLGREQQWLRHQPRFVQLLLRTFPNCVATLTLPSWLCSRCCAYLLYPSGCPRLTSHYCIRALPGHAHTPACQYAVNPATFHFPWGLGEACSCCWVRACAERESLSPFFSFIWWGHKR